jgi:hypothetical protein
LTSAQLKADNKRLREELEDAKAQWVTIEGKRARAVNPFVDLPKKDA